MYSERKPAMFMFSVYGLSRASVVLCVRVLYALYQCDGLSHREQYEHMLFDNVARESRKRGDTLMPY